VPPLYQSSVYCLPDLDALDRVTEGGEPGFIYARDAHPNAARLAGRLAELEGAAWAVMCGSGMAAVTAAMLATVQQGDRIIASNRLYGRTTQLFLEEASRFGVVTTLVDTTDLSQVEQALRPAAGGPASEERSLRRDEQGGVAAHAAEAGLAGETLWVIRFPQRRDEG
jgi:cystathionine gamma-synthase